MFNALPNIYDIPVGTGALLAFLILLAILGVGRDFNGAIYFTFKSVFDFYLNLKSSLKS
jgi:hypothetical protein